MSVGPACSVPWFLRGHLKCRLRRDVRAALLVSKKAIDLRNSRSIREELFTSSAVKEKLDLNEKDKITYVLESYPKLA